MSHDLRLTAEKITRRIALLRAHVLAQLTELAPFRLCNLPDAAAPPALDDDAAGWATLAWNSYWGGADRHFHIRSGFAVPDVPENAPDRFDLVLHMPLGVAGDIFTHPEALLYLDRVPVASVDRYHHTIALPDTLRAGQAVQLDLHGWTGLTGWPPRIDDPTQLLLRPCTVALRDRALQDFVLLAETAMDATTRLPPARTERDRILSALDEAFLVLDTWRLQSAEFRASVPAALERLRAGLAQAGAPLDVTLHGIGHAHMDVAYLWPTAQIRRKSARTTANVLRLMDEDPDFRFSHSQPQLYAWLERDFPDLFAAMAARVATGQWEAMGGMWVEADANMPGPEALARQIILGRRWFRDRFGDAETPVLWLPDTFGFPASLPQLMAQAGLKYFVSNKMSWNQYNPMPHSTTWWEGLDGTRVLAHHLTTPREVQHLPFPTNYKSDLSAAEVFGTWEQARGRNGVRELPICYGYGDGGGGPTEELIARARAYGAMPGAPRMQFSTVRACMEALAAYGAGLPVWQGELYLEGHRGVLTSQGWIKRANRKAELALHSAEWWQAHVRAAQPEAPLDDLTPLWQRLLCNQFHDILTGTAITEVFDDARKDFARIMSGAATAEANARARCRPGAGPVIVNTTGYPCADPVLVAEPGTAPGAQAVEGCWLVPVNPLPPHAAVPLAQAIRRDPMPAAALRVTETGHVLENGILRLRIGHDGALHAIHDLPCDRAVLAPGATGNQLLAYEDRPLSWDAWDIDTFIEDRVEAVTGTTTVEVAEEGPLRVALRITRHWRSSRITQLVRLTAGSRRIDFVTEVDWHERHILLRVAFPVAVRSPLATYDIQWGTVQRPTHRNTSWDYARFEVPAQQWVDLSEGDYGVALLNDCKYGHSVQGNILRLSLIKSSIMPDPTADQGHHAFTYALFPRQGGWQGQVPAAAAALNAPPRAVAEHPGTASPLVACDAPNVVLQTLKPADCGRGIILRLFDQTGCRGPVRLRTARPLARATVTDLLETPVTPLAVDGDAVTLHLAPHQIVTLHLEFADTR